MSTPPAMARDPPGGGLVKNGCLHFQLGVATPNTVLVHNVAQAGSQNTRECAVSGVILQLVSVCFAGDSRTLI